MLKLRKAMLCLLILSFVLLLNLSIALGQEGCIIPTVPGNVQGIENYLALQWAPGHPPDEIEPGANAVVKVVGGFPPIQWSVSGNGFSLEKVQEEDNVDHARTKLLIASPTACGPAEITVTDSHNSMTGCVRSTAGTWVSKGHYCGLSGSVTQCGSAPGYDYFELIDGRKKQRQTTVKSAGGTTACEDVAEGCESMLGYYCPEFGAENCIDGNPGHEFPYYSEEVGGGACYYRCYCVVDLEYFEYECAEE